MILLRIKFVGQCGQGVGQQGWRDGGIDQFAGGPGQQRPIADGKKAEAKIGKAAVMDDRLRRQTDDGVVAMPAGEFMEKMAGLPLARPAVRPRPAIPAATTRSRIFR